MPCPSSHFYLKPPTSGLGVPNNTNIQDCPSAKCTLFLRHAPVQGFDLKSYLRQLFSV